MYCVQYNRQGVASKEIRGLHGGVFSIEFDPIFYIFFSVTVMAIQPRSIHPRNMLRALCSLLQKCDSRSST